MQENDTISTVIRRIELGGMQIALVQASSGELVGTITDGDVRRGMIAGKETDALANEIMNRSPIVALESDSQSKIQKLLLNHELNHIPVISEDGVVVRIEVLRNLIQVKRVKNPVLIMAGGFGTRLKPLTNDCPKPMLKVGEKPMLEHILESFIESGFSDFYFSVHYLPEVIMSYFGDGSKFGVDITYVTESQPLGTAGALALLAPFSIELPLLVINADVLTSLNFKRLLDFHIESNAGMTIAVREYELEVPYGVVETNGKYVTDIVEKPIHSYFVSAGVYIIDAPLLRKLDGHYLDMPDFISRLIDEEVDVVRYPIYEYWLDIGRVDDFRQAQKDVLKLRK